MQHLSKSIRRWISHAPVHGPLKGDKVVVGMSGGVDSSVAAKLLAEEDYDLSAVFMRNWDTRDESGTDEGCEWKRDWEDVQRVCQQLGVPCQLIDLSREYWNNVFSPALEYWESGVTPNPDVWCNKEIKFGSLLERLPIASEKTWFATGHYARKSWTNGPDGSPRPQLLRGTFGPKDQSYYLSSISEAGLRCALFPLGTLTKPEVRELAIKWKLPTAERPESMGICFVGEKTKFNKFISSYLPPKPGYIVDETTGTKLGQHAGLWNYTIGQNAKVPGMPVKMFVSHKDPDSNIVHVVPGSDHHLLYSKRLYVPELNWIWKDAPPPEVDTASGFRARVMHRYRMHSVACTVRRAQHSGRIRIELDEPEKSVSPGQVAALYDGDWCLGSGTIERTA